jgi:hypothetical protein
MLRSGRIIKACLAVVLIGAAIGLIWGDVRVNIIANLYAVEEIKDLFEEEIIE